MNPKTSSSSGNRMNSRKLWKIAVPALALVLAFCSMLNLTRCSIRWPPLLRQGPPLAELDRRAQPHFDAAKATIPKIAEKLSTLKSLSRMCWYMATNKSALQNFLARELKPLTSHCAEGAAVYGVKLNTALFHDLVAETGKNNFLSGAYAVGGLGLEALFLKSLLRSLSKVLGAVAAKLAVSWTGAASCAAADGPLPVGDIVGVVMGVGGTVWSAYDLWQCRVRLPLEIKAVLNAAVDNVREQCRRQVRQ